MSAWVGFLYRECPREISRGRLRTCEGSIIGYLFPAPWKDRWPGVWGQTAEDVSQNLTFKSPNYRND